MYRSERRTIVVVLPKLPLFGATVDGVMHHMLMAKVAGLPLLSRDQQLGELRWWDEPPLVTIGLIDRILPSQVRFAVRADVGFRPVMLCIPVQMTVLTNALDVTFVGHTAAYVPLVNDLRLRRQL